MESILDERWLPVVGREGYMVSDHGRVKSLARLVKAPWGQRMTKEMILATWVCKNTGYLQCVLHRKKENVHTLVLTAFIGPRPEGKVCAHNNGKRDDARLCNLRWATQSENLMDMVEHGTIRRGERSFHAKLTTQDVLAIRADKRSRAAIARDYGVTPEAISHVVLRKNWKWLP